MKHRFNSPIPVSQVLEDVLNKKGLGPKIAQHAIFDCWEDVVGKVIAEKTNPLRIQGNHLVIAVEHSTWIQELQFLKPQLLEKIRKHFPKTTIKKLRFILAE